MTNTQNNSNINIIKKCKEECDSGIVQKLKKSAFDQLKKNGLKINKKQFDEEFKKEYMNTCILTNTTNNNTYSLKKIQKFTKMCEKDMERTLVQKLKKTALDQLIKEGMKIDEKDFDKEFKKGFIERCVLRKKSMDDAKNKKTHTKQTHNTKKNTTRKSK
jgi:hypothetical protein